MNHSEYFNEVLWQLFALLKVAWQFQAAPETTARKRRRLAKRIDKFLSMLALEAPISFDICTPGEFVVMVAL